MKPVCRVPSLKLPTIFATAGLARPQGVKIYDPVAGFWIVRGSTCVPSRLGIRIVMEEREDASGPPVYVTVTELSVWEISKVTVFPGLVAEATAGGRVSETGGRGLRAGAGTGFAAGGWRHPVAITGRMRMMHAVRMMRLIYGRWGGRGDKCWGFYPVFPDCHGPVSRWPGDLISKRD